MAIGEGGRERGEREREAGTPPLSWARRLEPKWPHNLNLTIFTAVDLQGKGEEIAFPHPKRSEPWRGQERELS